MPSEDLERLLPKGQGREEMRGKQQERAGGGKNRDSGRERFGSSVVPPVVMGVLSAGVSVQMAETAGFGSRMS